ncbi:MAG: hypothetical protein V4537_12280 [Pseudomonadota bacterium]
MTRVERLSVLGAALVAFAAPALLLGFGAEPVAREVAPVPLLVPRAAPPVTAAYARDLFGGGSATSSEDAVPADAPALAGIVGRIGQDAVAMVRTGDTTRTIAVGESVDGWTLESLAIDAAYFTRGGQRARVPLPAGD